MHSPGGSSTGSFCHGVRRYELFDPHVAPDPLSLTVKPLTGFPMTLIHGAGGRLSPVSRISYSPAAMKPPIPLKQSSPTPVAAGIGRESGVATATSGSETDAPTTDTVVGFRESTSVTPRPLLTGVVRRGGGSAAGVPTRAT